MIVGISGLLIDSEGNAVGSAGSGKDTVADVLVTAHGFTKIALADPLKRILRDVYAFTDLQLWGPSEERNKPDSRYPRDHTWVELSDGKSYSCSCCGQRVGRNSGRADEGAATQCYLTPRYALQLCGTQFGRHCYPDTWVETAIRTSKALLEQSGDIGYTVKEGLTTVPSGAAPKGVAISDVRFKNEIDGLKARGAKLIRIRRVGKGLVNATGLHQSERESAEIPDSRFDYVLENNGTLEELAVKIKMILA